MVPKWLKALLLITLLGLLIWQGLREWRQQRTWVADPPTESGR